MGLAPTSYNIGMESMLIQVRHPASKPPAQQSRPFAYAGKRARILAFIRHKTVSLQAMKIIRNRILPPRRYDAINIFGLFFCRKGTSVTPELVRHERIHTRQMAELLFVGFYLWYAIEWLIRLPLRGNAYRHLCFEREAYDHEDEPGYLKRRRPYAWLRYLRRRQGA